MFGEPLADREAAVHRVVLQRRHVGKWRRRRRTEQRVEHELAADDGRRARGVRRDRQDAALPQQPAAHAVLIQLDAAEARAVDVRNAVMLRRAAR